MKSWFKKNKKSFRDYKGEIQDSEKIDMFKDDEFSREFIKKNIENIISQLSKQFNEAEDSFREVLQNCIDSDTPQIDVYYNERPAENDDEVKLDMIFEDYGCGMTTFERDEYFLKLFKSSKWKNKRKIGKYGIGIASVFALDLDEFYTESCRMNKKKKKKEAWSLYLKGIKDKPGYCMEDIEERKGTKVILTKIMKKDEVNNFKFKAKKKMKYACKRSRTPIYVEKEYINEEFDIDSKIKLYKSYDGLEFVIAVTGKPFYEFYNNRLLLEEAESNPFSRWENISALVSSHNFKHTFSRDSIDKNKNFRKIINFIEKEIKHLFVNALERIDYYNKNPIPQFTERCPEIEIETNFRRYSLNNPRGIQKIRGILARKVIMDLITKQEAESFNTKIDEYEKEFYEYSRKRSEHNKQYANARNEVELCWNFVSSYIKKLSLKVDGDKDRSDLPFIGRVLSGKNIAEKIRPELPSEVYDFKIIPTINGNISFGELTDIFAKGKTVFRVGDEDIKLAELLRKQNKQALCYREYHINPLTQTIKILGSTESAARKYTVPCRLEDISVIEEREKKFLKGISKMLKKTYKSSINEIYFTNNTKLNKYQRDNDIVLIDQFGKIAIEKSIKHFTKKIMLKTRDFWTFKPRYDFAINLDSKYVQKMITIYHHREKHTSNLAFLFLKDHIRNNFPGLRPSNWTDSLTFGIPIDLIDASRSGQYGRK